MYVPRTALEEARLLSPLDKLGVAALTSIYTIASITGQTGGLLLLAATLVGLLAAALAVASPEIALPSTLAAGLALSAAAATVGLHRRARSRASEAMEDGVCPRDAPYVAPAAAKISRFDLQPTPDGFVDGLNRAVLLRGVNLGGMAKIPAQDEGTHASRNREEFYNGKVSYIGRPLKLEDADEHLARLASWGMTCVRLLITWEAVEPEAPGVYDEEYLNYLLTLVRKADKHGLSVYVDPHQDVWSRFTGGDGAPKWTLEKVGFEVGSNLHTCGAAFVHGELKKDEDMPRMTWPTNYGKLAASTMFTLFFAGNTYAPATKIDGVPAQTFLQNAYVAMMGRVAEVLKDEANVLGFDSMNEPTAGYVGHADLRRSQLAAPMGMWASGFDGMVMGAGYSRSLPNFTLPLIYNGTVEWNQEGASAWKAPEFDVWRANGVWKIDEDTKQPVLLRPDHFATRPGEEDFVETYMVPFFLKLREAFDKHSKAYVVFAEPSISLSTGRHGSLSRRALQTLHRASDRWGWVPHFYDGFALVTKTYLPWLGLDLHPASFMPPVAIGKWMIDRAFKKAGEHMNAVEIPVIVGETGIAMDLNGKRAFRSGDFSDQVECLDRTLRAFELLSTSIWNYAAENDNRRGDQWNGEDLSLWSRDQLKDASDLNSGGRALRAAVRPYVMRAAGKVVDAAFSPRDRRYTVSIKVTSGGIRESIVFLPKLHYPDGKLSVKVSSGSVAYLEGREQGLVWTHGRDEKVQWLEATRTLSE